jgi:large subunit ribosomal protein L30
MPKHPPIKPGACDERRKTVKVRQTGSPMRRHFSQRQTLVGLKLNKIGRVAELVDTPQTRGMIAKVAHLIEVVEK